MCRGPFKFRQIKEWIEEKRSRDLLFEEGFDMILEQRRVFRTIYNDDDVLVWHVPVDKMTKLKEYQLAYNAVDAGTMDWYDEDFEEFVLYDDVRDLVNEPKECHWVYWDTTDRWFTQYPHLI